MAQCEVKTTMNSGVGRLAGIKEDKQCFFSYRVQAHTNASICASESRAMTAVGKVNDRVTDLAITQRQEAQELYREAVIARQAWSRSEDRSTALEATIRAQEARNIALEARVRALQTQYNRMEWQRQDAGPQDGPADAGSSC
ncbi:hypothetical protein Tco_1369368 [Tanacetum coccineum]